MAETIDETQYHLAFTKMHGCGNDFVMIKAEDLPSDLHTDEALSRLAQVACERRRGVGADGLIVAASPDDAERYDLKFIYYNSDGSKAEMCGNGIRCFARFAQRHHLAPEDRLKTGLRVDTPAGLIVPVVHDDGTVTVDMGPPRLPLEQVPVDTAAVQPAGEHRYQLAAQGREILFVPVSMGNPHMVVFQPAAGKLDPAEFGPVLETHAAFPAKTNVEFVEQQGDNAFKVIVWERGCGFTEACGTGACAVGVAARLLDKVSGDGPWTVQLPGGALDIAWSGSPADSVMMRGPATFVFRGVLDYTPQ